MSVIFQLRGEITSVGRSLTLATSPGALFVATVDIDPAVEDAAAVTSVIGTYPRSIRSVAIDLGGILALELGNDLTTKIVKRTADPYAYLLEAEMVSPHGPGHARGNFEVLLQRRSEHAPANDVDDLAPPVVRHYAQRRWRIWLSLDGAPPSKVEGVLGE